MNGAEKPPGANKPAGGGEAAGARPALGLFPRKPRAVENVSEEGLNSPEENARIIDPGVVQAQLDALNARGKPNKPAEKPKPPKESSAPKPPPSPKFADQTSQNAVIIPPGEVEAQLNALKAQGIDVGALSRGGEPNKPAEKPKPPNEPSAEHIQTGPEASGLALAVVGEIKKNHISKKGLAALQELNVDKLCDFYRDGEQLLEALATVNLNQRYTPDEKRIVMGQFTKLKKLVAEGAMSQTMVVEPVGDETSSGTEVIRPAERQSLGGKIFRWLGFGSK